MPQTLLRTPLYDRHVEAGGRMVPFAGWEMPVQYEGVIQEHRAVRTDAGVFDVSHMGEIEVEGPRAHDLLQGLLSNDLDRVQPGAAQYTLLTNERGGIIDDLIAYRLDPHRYLLVVNASNREPAFEWLRDHEIRGSDVRDVSDEYALLAVQGPRALERLGLPEAPAFTWQEGDVDGVECMVNYTGYTGEPGVELMTMADDAPALWDRVLERGVVPAGLGARDTLRLEVCYPLHGNDIGPDTDAISAGLGWTCALDKDFTGAETLRAIKEQGPERRLAPFVMDEKAVPRQGMPVVEGGEVTSGTHSPMLEIGIGMAYIPAELAEPGTEITIDVRGSHRRAHVVKKPIYQRGEA
jgi:aminomethyltransferase